MRLIIVFLLLPWFSSLVAQSDPNVLFILADDLGYGELSYTDSVYDTPNLDSLAVNGFYSSNFHVQPVCTASRYSFMTGKYPFRVNLAVSISWPFDDPQWGLPLTDITIAEYFKESGYMCGVFGKWNLGTSSPDYFPQKHGFDYFWGGSWGLISLRDSEAYGVWCRVENMERDTTDCDFETDCQTDKLLEWIDDRRGDTSTPWFAYYNFTNPHDDFQGSDSIPYKQADYDLAPSWFDDGKKQKWASIKNMDDNVGRMIDSLESWGIDSNTIVVFTSDNGPDPTNDPITSGYNGTKWYNYEGGTRVPFIWYHPGSVSAGSSSDSLTSIEDMLPTLIEGVLGKELRDSTDGQNFYPLLSGGVIPQKHWMGSFVKDRCWSVTKGRWKLANNISQRANNIDPLSDNIELFDLVSDPGETTDVSGANPAKVTELQSIINSYTVPDTRSVTSSDPSGWENPRWWGDPSRSECIRVFRVRKGYRIRYRRRAL
jgi:arylsulfatase A